MVTDWGRVVGDDEDHDLFDADGVPIYNCSKAHLESGRCEVVTLDHNGHIDSRTIVMHKAPLKYIPDPKFPDPRLERKNDV
jgi:hypothetical protein